MATLFRVSLLDAPTPEWLRAERDGHVLVDDSGVIASTGPWREAPDGGYDRIVTLEDTVLVPAFSDAHAHVPQHDIAGIGGADLLTWLDEVVFPAEERFSDPAVARDVARRFMDALVASGTAAAGLYLTSHVEATRVAFEEARRARVSGWMGKVLMDRGAPKALLDESPERAVADAATLATDLDTPTMRFSINPRFAPACSPRLLALAGGLAQRRGLPVQTHVSESMEEIARVAELFPGARDYTSIYEDAHLLGHETLLAHGVHLAADEWERITRTDTVVVHCPLANHALHAGRFPIEDAPTRARLALGSDVGAGPTPSLWANMRDALHRHPLGAVSATRLLHLATVAGADALGVPIGRFAVGKRASFQELARGSDAASWQPETWLRDVIARTDRPRANWVNGSKRAQGGSRAE